MNKLIKTLILFLFCQSVFAYEYNTDLINYKGGVISQLNNCGPVYTSSGRYIWGVNPLATPLQSGTAQIENIYSVSGGVLSVTSDNKAYFSPDGKHLSGGGNTRYLGQYSSAHGYGDKIFLQTVSRTITRGSAATTKSLFTVYTHPGSASESKKTVEVSNKSGIRYEIVGEANGHYFIRSVIVTQLTGRQAGQVRKAFKELASFTSIEHFNTKSSSYAVLHRAEMSTPSRGSPSRLLNGEEMTKVGQIQKIMPYNGGILAYGNTWVNVSNNGANIVEGAGTGTLYSGSRAIASLINRGGDSGVGGSSKGILISYKDGYTYWSENGANLAGNGNTKTITRPFNAADIEREMSYYLNNDRHYQLIVEYPYSIENLKIGILNKYESAEFSKNFFIGSSGGGFSALTAMASDFKGEPALMRVYDKGWSGWEYKWRDRGVRTGLIDHSYSGSFIGDLGIKLKAEKTCAIVVGLETIGDDIKPFEFTWDINPDGSFAFNNPLTGSDTSSQNNPWGTFAEGELDFMDFYPKTLFERIMLLVYEGADLMRDKNNKPVVGVPVSSMKM